MARNNTANSGIRELRKNQEKLVGALQMLVDLLEDYAPRWYTREHHDLACEALASAKGSRARLSVRQRPIRRRIAS